MYQGKKQFLFTDFGNMGGLRRQLDRSQAQVI